MPSIFGMTARLPVAITKFFARSFDHSLRLRAVKQSGLRRERHRHPAIRSGPANRLARSWRDARAFAQTPFRKQTAAIVDPDPIFPPDGFAGSTAPRK